MRTMSVYDSKVFILNTVCNNCKMIIRAILAFSIRPYIAVYKINSKVNI